MTAVIWCASLSGTGTTKARLVEAMQSGQIGMMATPMAKQAAVPDGVTWCADTGLFSGRFCGPERYLRWLQDREAISDDCLFATAPDVPYDAAATLKASWPMLGWIRYAGFRAAFVAQNGLIPACCPWDDFDVLFLGGDNDFKLGPDGRALTDEALSRGVPVHMGRVNSLRRLRYAAHIGCASADGSFLRFGPTIRLPEALSWARDVEELTPLFDRTDL